MQPRLFLFVLTPIMLFFLYPARIQGEHVSLFFSRANASLTGSLTFKEILGQNVARLNTKFKEIFPIRANPRPSIWFCLVKARRDWNSPIKINLKLIMA